MQKYDYLEAVKADVKEYIEDNIDREDWIDDRDGLETQLNDDCFIDDSVTGNASGSYYCNAYKAREALAMNSDILVDTLECFGDEPESYKKAITDPEYADCTIRCYLVAQAVSEVLDELEEDGYFDEEDNDE